MAAKSRTFTVEGPRGKLIKTFKHIKCSVTVGEEETREGAKQTVVTIEMYLNTYKQAALLKTIKGHISNMITGVTEGYRYKMHTVFKHFGIDLQIIDRTVTIKHFLGETDTKCIKLREGVTATLKGKDQEEIWFEGNDINAVSLNCDWLIRLRHGTRDQGLQQG